MFLAICLFMGILTATAVMISVQQGKDWLFAVAFGLIGIYGSFIIQKILSPVLLFLIIFLIPLRIDFYLIFKKSYYILTGYPGIPVTAFDIVLTVLIAHLVVDVLQGKRKFEFFPSISIPAVVYILLAGISATYSKDLTLSISNFLLIIKSWIVFLYFANRIKNNQDITITVLALCCAVLFQSLIGGLQYVSGGSFMSGAFGLPQESFKEQIQGTHLISRVGGTFGHPNELAKYLCFCIPVLICYTYTKYHLSLRILAFVSALAAGLTLIMTMARGSWLALGLTSMFLFYKILNRYLKSFLKSSLAVLFICSFLAISIIGLFEDVRVRLFEDDYGSAESRIPMAEIAVKIILDHPLTGIGLNNYTRVMQKYDHSRNWQTYQFPHPVHNSFLLIAAESGIPAIFAFLMILYSVFRIAIKSIRDPYSDASLLQVGFAGACLTWVIAGIFDRDFGGVNTMLWFTFGMIAAMAVILKDDITTH